MHKEVRRFCESIKDRFPEYFINKSVLDCGSLDINGNNRYLFEKGNYIGIDICKGPNVDYVKPVHKFTTFEKFDVVISTEMLEHDVHWSRSILKMFQLTQCGGLLIITAAGTDRPEHGTSAYNPGDSPKTHDYYKNITAEMLTESLSLEDFSWFEISYINTDIRFAGIKR